jgi:serine phosphatase RsbU (regulator of sigma subunit)
VFITAVVIGLAGFVLYDRWVFYIVYTFIVIISPPTGHKIFLKRNDNLGGEWVIRSGFLVMSAAGIYQMFLSFGWVPPIFGIYVVYFYGVLGFIVSMSILLARDFAVTNKYLELQLENVQQLSDKTLKQELEKKELETRDKILEADNQRKTRELEDARKLQLSMLPQSLPDIANLKIAAYMSTATEVGGDYYDFIKSKDGTLNIAVGDATGHGMKAGTMVASIKSLFAALGGSMMIPDFFNKCTEIIKSMKLGNLFMSMTILRIKGNYLIASSAGMPPMKICRDQKNKIDDIILKGMPLGAFAKYDYIEYEEELNEGDTIILMSDGLPELFNSKKEMLGDNRINQVIIDYIDKSPQEIIDAMVEVGEKWRGETAQEDDITLIVIKFV